MWPGQIFVSPVQNVLDAFGVQKDARGNARAATEGEKSYQTSKPNVFAAGESGEPPHLRADLLIGRRTGKNAVSGGSRARKADAL